MAEKIASIASLLIGVYDALLKYALVLLMGNCFQSHSGLRRSSKLSCCASMFKAGFEKAFKRNQHLSLNIFLNWARRLAWLGHRSDCGIGKKELASSFSILVLILVVGSRKETAGVVGSSPSEPIRNYAQTRDSSLWPFRNRRCS